MKSWREENRRGRVKILVFSLLPVTVLVVVAEGLTAMAIHRSFGVHTDDLSGRKFYEFRMGLYPWSHVSRTPLNSLGYPDDEFVNLKPKGSCKHLVFVGDSFTFGDGVDRDDNYVSLVRSWASKKFPDRCIRFFNIGVRAITIEQQARHLEKVWDAIEPDIVILAQYQNDLTDLTKPGFSGHVDQENGSAQRNWRAPKVRIPVIGASIVRWLSYQMIATLSVRGVPYDLLSRWSVMADGSNAALATRLMSQYTAEFDSTVTRIRERNAQFGVIILPSKFDVLAQRSPEEKFFLDLAQKHTLPALPLLPTFHATRAQYPFLMYDGHLNRYGNYIVAKEVMAWLFEKDPAPFTDLRSASRSSSLLSHRGPGRPAPPSSPAPR